MEKSGTIVYIGTEDNLKSCLGLSSILEDGWDVKLVIAYDSHSISKAQDSLLHSVKQSIIKVIRYQPKLYNTIRTIFNKHDKIEYKRMGDLCKLFDVPYISTTDKTLLSVRDQINANLPDIILSNGWMFKITYDIFTIARIIALNCHSSYLPEYRGGNVTFAPLINQEKQSGVTVHQLVENFDAGLILAQERVDIAPNETPETLNLKRAKITGEVLIKALEIAGFENLYKPNPISPFYFRCNYKTYKRYKRINNFRKFFGLPIKRYEPRERYDI
ncbi:formyltransferase family protein [Chloroflexota bacterium]